MQVESKEELETMQEVLCLILSTARKRKKEKRSFKLWLFKKKKKKQPCHSALHRNYCNFKQTSTFIPNDREKIYVKSPTFV